jgi:hypothetical protein
LIFGGAGGAISAVIVSRVKHIHFPEQKQRNNKKTRIFIF